MIKRFWLIMGMIAVGICNVYGQQPSYRPVDNVGQVKNTLDSISNHVQTIKSEFVQQKHMKELSVTVQSKGKFWFKKENSIRWEYTEPFQYSIIINKGNLQIDDEGKKSRYNVNQSNLFQEVGHVITRLVKGEIGESQKYDLTFQENNQYYLISMIPKNQQLGDILSEMRMFFDKETFMVSKIKMIEQKDNYTLIRFKNRKINEAVSDEIFSMD